MEKAAGKMTGNTEHVERGEERQVRARDILKLM